MLDIRPSLRPSAIPPEKREFLKNVNRRFRNPNVYVDYGELGFSVRAARPIRKGEFILAFEGPLLSLEDTIRNGEEECMALQFGPNLYIDTRPPGRFVNHSCEPNAGIKGSFDLMALEDIARDREIRFDYSTTMDEDHYHMPCKCGKPACRGIVTDFRLLPEDVRSRYLDLGIVSDFIRRKYPDSQV